MRPYKVSSKPSLNYLIVGSPPYRSAMNLSSLVLFIMDRTSILMPINKQDRSKYASRTKKHLKIPNKFILFENFS